MLLKGLGSSETVTTESRICCDVCESGHLAQRDAVVEGNPALKMFPNSVFCPLNVMQDVHSKSSSVKCIHDMQSFSCLRKSFIHLFSLLLQAYVVDI